MRILVHREFLVRFTVGDAYEVTSYDLELEEVRVESFPKYDREFLPDKILITRNIIFDDLETFNVFP